MSLRTLISSNGPHSHTGYGTQTKSLMQALINMGHEVAVHCWYGIQGGVIRSKKYTLFPAVKHAYGADTGVVARHWKADLVITLQDVWVLPGNYAESLPCPWVAWFPIDGDPIAPPILERVRKAAYPVAYSRYAFNLLEAAGVRADYIPHGIDTAVFSPGSKEKARADRSLSQDAFIVSMVAANKGYPARKSFYEAFAAFKLFYDNHPNAILYLHTEQYPEGEGLNLLDVLRLAGVPDSAVMWVDQEPYLLGLPDDEVADVYRFSDVLLAPSTGEGFGLPIAEAQACGCPVIVNDCTSMSELVCNGLAVRPLQPTYTPIGQLQYVADIKGLHNALEEVYGWDSEHRTIMAQHGVEFIRESYEWGMLAEKYWRPFLQTIEEATKP